MLGNSRAIATPVNSPAVKYLSLCAVWSPGPFVSVFLSVCLCIVRLSVCPSVCPTDCLFCCLSLSPVPALNYYRDLLPASLFRLSVSNFSACLSLPLHIHLLASFCVSVYVSCCLCFPVCLRLTSSGRTTAADDLSAIESIRNRNPSPPLVLLPSDDSDDDCISNMIGNDGIDERRRLGRLPSLAARLPAQTTPNKTHLRGNVPDTTVSRAENDGPGKRLLTTRRRFRV